MNATSTTESRYTQSDLAVMRREVNRLNEQAALLAESIRDKEIALQNCNQWADDKWAEYLAAYEEVNGEPWTAPEPSYREIPGLE